MSIDGLRRISYAVPCALIALLAWLGNLPWWAVALLAGLCIFVWDWLWGDTNLLNSTHCLILAGAGSVCLVVSFYLSNTLNLSLEEFQKLAGGLARSQRLIYHLPVVGIALTLYGFLGWGRAWLVQQNTRW